MTSAQPVIPYGVTSKEGWLIKLSGFLFRSWEQRWFSIIGSSLLYFRLRTDQEPRKVFGTSTSAIIDWWIGLA